MHVCVLGGGVVGVTTAYFLAREGFKVTVVEQRSETGVGASFANGGQLSYSYVAPLAGPSVLSHLPAWLLSRSAPLRFHPSLDFAQWAWCAEFLRNCTRARSRQTTIELLQLGAYSRETMHQLMTDVQIDFAFRKSGKLVVYRDADEFDGARRLMEFQASFGTEQTALDATACVSAEPALASIGDKLVGGIYTPSEETGDCFLFTRELGRTATEELGVRFLYETSLRGLRQENGKIVAALTSNGDIVADEYVVALGNGSRELLRPLGIRLPMLPLKGYSLTVPVGEGNVAPDISVTDLHHKIVYARLGQQLRIAGMVDMTPEGSREDATRIQLLKSQAESTMPEAGDYSAAQIWTGARPTTPDSKPFLGPTHFSNLWLNTGQGSLGFTLAAASSKLVVDTLCRRAPALDLAPYQLHGRNVMRDHPTTFSAVRSGE
ncbi:D-amino acid dehydrogenase [Paraburkholderia sp. Ac-20342]|uniref:D-amino acid dehydrogenase n=1 Tax=Paraburkholderia sp. Ac-20342 TaxID=2703889 RepID=UPI00197F5094|nr:D-amino acid dehydrogenase [Paraburkholderia sp. Ac-20342]MBN3851660.1 D-amino acid dehydrogenase [Paraburkholderia sp. Ac-20342]